MADVLNPNSPEEKLAQFLRACAAKPAKWGEFDCGLWLADWAIALEGLSDDPAAELRGRYHDEAECEDVVLGSTPYPIVVSRIARAIGWRGASRPYAIGTIAIVEALEDQVVGAIRTAGGWVMLSKPKGIVRTSDNLRVLGAWEAPWFR